MTPTQRAAMTCPFCGSKRIGTHYKKSGTKSGYQCMCLDCQVAQTGRYHPSIDAAREEWSKRAALAEQPAEQEPVAYWHKRGQDDEEFVHAEAVNGKCPYCIPLFTTPQPAQVNPAFQAIADAEAAEAESEYLRRLREQDCSQNIESPFNACMYKGYCLSLKAKLELEEASHHRPVLPELEAQINVALGLETPTAQQVREFARSGGSAIVTGHQEYTFTDERLHRFVLAAIKKFAAKQEPVAVVAPYPDYVDWLRDEPPVGTNLYTAPQPAKPAEPLDGKLVMGLAVIRELTGTQKTDNIEATIEAVRKAVAPQPAKQPLTDEEIAALWLDSISGPLTATKFARAVIAAYDAKNGITGETK